MFPTTTNNTNKTKETSMKLFDKLNKVNRVELRRADKFCLTRGMNALMEIVGDQAYVQDVLDDWENIEDKMLYMDRVGEDTVWFMHHILTKENPKIRKEERLTLEHGEVVSITDTEVKVFDERGNVIYSTRRQNNEVQ